MNSVTAAEVAALGAWRALLSGDRVGSIVFNESEAVELRPHRSSARVLRVLHEFVRFNRRLASPEPVSGEIELNDVLARAVHLAAHDHLIVLVSDLDGADSQTRRLATMLAAHNHLLVAGVYDPLGASLTGYPGMMATDRGRVWEVSGGATFAADFRRSFQVMLDHWTDVFRALRVPVLPIATAEPVVDQIRSLLGQRRMR